MRRAVPAGDIRVIDQDDGPVALHESRAIGIHARSLEIMRGVGFAEEMVAKDRRVRAIRLHAHGRQIAGFEFTPLAVDTAYPFILTFRQGQTPAMKG